LFRSNPVQSIAWDEFVRSSATHRSLPRARIQPNAICSYDRLCIRSRSLTGIGTQRPKVKDQRHRGGSSNGSCNAATAATNRACVTTSGAWPPSVSETSRGAAPFGLHTQCKPRLVTVFSWRGRSAAVADNIVCTSAGRVGSDRPGCRSAAARPRVAGVQELCATTPHSVSGPSTDSVSGPSPAPGPPSPPTAPDTLPDRTARRAARATCAC
jgi:hypothetical protein